MQMIKFDQDEENKNLIKSQQAKIQEQAALVTKLQT